MFKVVFRTLLTFADILSTTLQLSLKLPSHNNINNNHWNPSSDKERIYVLLLLNIELLLTISSKYFSWSGWS